MSKLGRNEREFFRINYKGDDQPHFVMGKKRFTVIDISEAGFRFGLPKNFTFYEQETIEGTLGFPGRGFVTVKGIIVRVTKDDVAVRLENPGRIPLSKIMEEQRFLIRKGKL